MGNGPGGLGLGENVSSVGLELMISFGGCLQEGRRKVEGSETTWREALWMWSRCMKFQLCVNKHTYTTSVNKHFYIHLMCKPLPHGRLGRQQW
jgi:hypothetical protein